MVKRAVAAMVGALAGVLLWHLALWIRVQAHEAEVITVETCEPNALVDCVGYETVAPAEPAPQPCKDWLTSERADAATLSQCLHRPERAREIAGST